MLVRKTKPIGIDHIIDSIQVKLDAITDLQDATWDNFPRAYKNPKRYKNSGFIPEVYNGKGEYIDCLMNDKINLTTFFVADSSVDYLNRNLTDGLSLIVQCSDLEELFPSIEHRADEELVHMFLDKLQNAPGVKITSINKTIEEVYREFDKTEIQFDDMGVFFVFRINMTTTYKIECCLDC